MKDSWCERWGWLAVIWGSITFHPCVSMCVVWGRQLIQRDVHRKAGAARGSSPKTQAQVSSSTIPQKLEQRWKAAVGGGGGSAHAGAAAVAVGGCSGWRWNGGRWWSHGGALPQDVWARLLLTEGSFPPLSGISSRSEPRRLRVEGLLVNQNRENKRSCVQWQVDQPDLQRDVLLSN